MIYYHMITVHVDISLHVSYRLDKTRQKMSMVHTRLSLWFGMYINSVPHASHLFINPIIGNSWNK